MIFPEYVSFTLDRLENCGYSAYLVGGCVRDYIMGNEPNDYDITTNAKPWQIEECFSDVKTLDIGKKHGTITLVFDDGNVEVTTYRVDGEYKDSRHPESVTFTDRIEDDLARRDFTMNAVAFSPKRGFVDPFFGRADIENRIIRCVGIASVRFEEDALRIMRALRFLSRLGFEVEENTKKAVFEKKALLLNIALERINAELCGILSGKYASTIVNDFFDVFKTIIPLLSRVDCKALQRASEFCVCVKECVFFYDFGDMSVLRDELKRLKYDNTKIKRITAVLSLARDSFKRCSDADIKKVVSKIGEEPAIDLYHLLYCRTGDDIYLEAVKKFYCFFENNVCMSLKQLDVKGNEIIDLYKLNPSLTGYVLSSLLNDVIDDIVKNEKGALLERAKLYI